MDGWMMKMNSFGLGDTATLHRQRKRVVFGLFFVSTSIYFCTLFFYSHNRIDKIFDHFYWVSKKKKSNIKKKN